MRVQYKRGYIVGKYCRKVQKSTIKQLNMAIKVCIGWLPKWLMCKVFKISILSRYKCVLQVWKK